MKLRPFTLVTGSVAIEGGDSSERTESTEGNDQEFITKRKVTSDRRRGNTIQTSARRSVRKLGVLTTPWGVLVPLERMQQLQEVLDGISRKVAEFNTEAKTTELTNAFVREPFVGVKRSLVEGWINRRVRTRRVPDEIRKELFLS